MQDTKAAAQRLSAALKDLHRALIKAEVGGDKALANPYSQLFALVNDPRFSWMGAASRLIVRVDAFGDNPDEADDTLNGLRRDAAALIAEHGDDDLVEFRMRRLVALQQEPDVGMATGRLRAELARKD